MTNKALVRIRVGVRAWIKIYMRARNYYLNFETFLLIIKVAQYNFFHKMENPRFRSVFLDYYYLMTPNEYRTDVDHSLKGSNFAQLFRHNCH